VIPDENVQNAPIEPFRNGMNEIALTMKMSPQLRDAIGRAAARRQLSVSGWMRESAREALRAQGVQI
jgi:hypothetical protein